MRPSKRILVSATLLLTATTAYALDFKELCSYDRLCSKLRDDKGAAVKPKVGVKRLVELMSDPILEFSERYGVDPRAVAGAILAENTMNVSVDDDLQNFIVKYQVMGHKNLLNQGMSVGPGQINLQPAMDADQYIASLGLRKARTPNEISQRLLTPSGAAEYAAAIIRHAQDEYKKEGVDISTKPDVLASLYNMGQSTMSFQRRAHESKATGKPPRPTYFGYFVTENLEEIENIIGWSPSRGRFGAKAKRDDKPGTILSVKADLTLQAAPPECLLSGTARDQEWTIRQSWRDFKNIHIKAPPFLEVTGRSVDCQLREWVQVRSSRDEIGWIMQSELRDATTPSPRDYPMRRCRAGTSACQERISEAYGAKPEPMPGKIGIFRMPARSKDPSIPTAVYDAAKIKFFQCDGDIESLKKNTEEYLRTYERELKAASKPVTDEEVDAYLGYTSVNNQNGYNNGGSTQNGYIMMPPQQQAPPLGQKELAAYADQWKKKKEEITTYLGLEKFEDPRNPFLQHFLWMDQTIWNEYDSGLKEYRFQNGAEDRLKELLSTDLQKISSIQELEGIQQKIQQIVYSISVTRAPYTKELLEAYLKKLQDRHDAIRKKNLPALERAKEMCEKVSPQLGRYGNRVVRLLEEAKGNALEANLQLAKKMEAACLRSYALVTYSETGKFPWGTQEADCDFTNLKSDRYNSYQGSGGFLSLSLDLLKKLKLKESDHQQMLMPVMEELERFQWDAPTLPFTAANIPTLVAQYGAQPANQPQGNVSQASSKDQEERRNKERKEMKTRLEAERMRSRQLYARDIESLKYNLHACNYSPLETAKAIERLATVPCVATVLVNDMSLTKGANLPKDVRIVKDSGISSGHIGFLYKDGCQTEKRRLPRAERGER